jgi:hypothetical protein
MRGTFRPLAPHHHAHNGDHSQTILHVWRVHCACVVHCLCTGHRRAESDMPASAIAIMGRITDAIVRKRQAKDLKVRHYVLSIHYDHYFKDWYSLRYRVPVPAASVKCSPQGAHCSCVCAQLSRSFDTVLIRLCSSLHSSLGGVRSSEHSPLVCEEASNRSGMG